MLTRANLHIPVSIACYLACLFFPAYYVGDGLEPQMAYMLLLMGWLGPLDGHFAWFANPLFLLALLTAKRPRLSSVLGFAGLALALSFLFYGRVAVSEAPTHAAITAYGWGYGLWVASLTVLSVGQALRARGAEADRVAAGAILACGLVLGAYLAYYALGDSSLSAIGTERDRVFAEGCEKAGEQIFRKTRDVKGVFFDPDRQWQIRPKASGSGSAKYISSTGVIGLIHLNAGHLAFYETRDRNDPNAYLKHVPGDHRGIPSRRLESEYAVVTDFHEIPPRLNISGATVTIRDRRDNSVLATSTFFIDRESGRFCGPSRDILSTSALVTEVLGLQKRYPSPSR